MGEIEPYATISWFRAHGLRTDDVDLGGGIVEVTITRVWWSLCRLRNGIEYVGLPSHR